MSTDTPEGFQERTEAVPPFKIKITSYKIGEKYYSTVDNVDPGAVIARSSGATREEAELHAIGRARERLGYSLASLRSRQE